MYKHLSEFVVRISDLLEAEGRVLRKVLGKLGLGLSLSLVAAVVLLVGCGLLLAGAWLGLAQPLGPAWASAITGAIAVLMAGALLVIASNVQR
jgi:hypothetical protein